MLVYRIHRPIYDVFDTTGAFLNQGRWHSVGTRVIYTAKYASLAVLEALVNTAGRKLPARLLTRIFIPDSCRMEQADWMEKPDSRRFGDAWIQEKRSAVLAVPSAVMNRLEQNFLLNPAHPDFRGIGRRESEEFVFDPRFSVEPG
jgi:RES domain-containing protein